MNNPIAVIQGNMEVICDDLGPSAQALKTELALVDAQVHRIDVLVNKLLQFARPEQYAGVGEYTRPNGVIRDTLPLVLHLLNNVHIDLVLDLKSGRIIVMNRIELQQVAINFMVKAIHAMPDSGELRASTENHLVDSHEGIQITLEDSGAAMSPKIPKRIFDPFFTTKSSEGTGLVLSISHKLVTRSEGEIRVDSDKKNGTRFHVFFKTIADA